MRFELLVRNTSEVVTCAGDVQGPAEGTLAPVAHGAVGIEHGRLVYLGPEASLPAGAGGPFTQVIDAMGGFVGPGFVDAHTHLVFAGERSAEFEERTRGTSPRTLSGGIASTVRATRAASEDALVELALPRLRRLLAFGVTTA